MTAGEVDVEFARLLRAEVLRPGRPASELCYPGDDAPETLHVGIAGADGAPLGAASVMRDPYPPAPGPGDWRIRGMATRAQARGRGLGTALLDACIAHAAGHGGTVLWCNARVRARTLYERAGLTVVGVEFEIPGIGPHRLMRMLLTRR